MMENDTVTDITKQRLVGSLLLLLVIAGTAFFLIDQTNDDNAIIIGQDSDFVSSIEPMPVEFVEVDQETLLDPHQLEDSIEAAIVEESPAVPTPEKEIVPVKPKEETPIVDTSKPSWIIQLGSFSVQANAQALHDKASKLGLSSKIEQSGANYRVRIGPEYDKQYIDSTVKKLTKQLGITPQVLSQQAEVTQ